MISKTNSYQERPPFLAIIPAVIAGYMERKGPRVGIRPKIRPFWPDRLDALLFNWPLRHFPQHRVAGGIPQQLSQWLWDSGQI